MGEWIGVIPAAGLGTRAYPYTATIPKGLLPVDGVPLLKRNLELLRDQVGVAEVRIVIGYRGEAIEQTFGDGTMPGPATCVTARVGPDAAGPAAT